MAVHLKVGNRNACKQKGGFRTTDVWMITCQKCLGFVVAIRPRPEVVDEET